VNIAEEAVAELLPYKELFTSGVPGQELYILFSCLLQLVNLPMTNSSANATNSKANVPDPIAKASNLIAKATN